jgi:hypothetical protein
MKHVPQWLRDLDDYHHREWQFVDDIEPYRHFERKGWVETRSARPLRYQWGVRLTPEGRRRVREPKIDGRRAHLHRSG